jgi:AcrR family transcriptional regulator
MFRTNQPGSDGAATRRRILDSALTAFVTRGYSSTTMDAVAADAGVAVQTVYFAFRAKGDLLQAVYEHAVLGSTTATTSPKR